MAFTSASGIESAAPTGGWARSLLLAAAAAASIGASPAASVEVDVTGLRSLRGLVRACLTADPAHFPDCQSDPAARRVTVPAAQAGTFRFDGVASGDYAIALIHDENGNGRLDTFAGIPREGFGFSRNPVLRFGPPRFSAAQFVLGNSAVGEAVRVKYLL